MSRWDEMGGIGDRMLTFWQRAATGQVYKLDFPCHVVGKDM